MKRWSIDLLPFEIRREVLDQIAGGIGSRDTAKWLQARGHKIDHTSVFRYAHYGQTKKNSITQTAENVPSFILYKEFPGGFAGVRDVTNVVRKTLRYSENHSVHIEQRIFDKGSRMEAFYANDGLKLKTARIRVNQRELRLFQRLCRRYPMASASNVVRALVVIGLRLQDA